MTHLTNIISIDSGIPLPTRKGRGLSYPFDDLDIGDSFFVPNRSSSDIQACKALAKQRRPGTDYTTRTAVVDGTSGIRVWRTA